MRFGLAALGVASGGFELQDAVKVLSTRLAIGGELDPHFWRARLVEVLASVGKSQIDRFGSRVVCLGHDHAGFDFVPVQIQF